MDVLEHIPDYHLVIAHFIACLAPGDIIIECSPFDGSAGKIGIHLKPSVPMNEAMRGMESIGNGVWKKRD
jgi:hypothetical protein